MKKYFFILMTVFLLSGCQNKIADKNMFKNIREAKTAGRFYPADTEKLQSAISQFLQAAPKEEIEGEIKAIMVPHAGYDFSGAVAASAYKQLEGKKIGTAVIICNSHAAYFEGVAVDNHEAWHSPLGTVEVDKILAEKLVNYDKAIQYNIEPFAASDQTIEVQIPFLQTVLKNDFKILPIYFGNSDEDDYKILANALADNLEENDIIVVSTDMSHYPSYENANEIDKRSLEIIKSGNITKLNKHIDDVTDQGIDNEETTMCGIDGVKTVLEICNLKKWDNMEILKYANSGDVSIGSKDGVVGYGAMAFLKNNNMINDNKILNQGQQQRLLEIAKTAVEDYVKDKKVMNFEINDKRLNWPEGAFVTIHKNGELRGCIGQIISTGEPLWKVVREMAIAAATEDNRFLPVSKDELEKLDYEISVLSEPEPIDDWQKIESGKHGVIVKQGRHTGVFLPQVAEETSWSKEEFLSQLCTQKAGLPADCYKDKNVELLVFTAQVFGDE